MGRFAAVGWVACRPLPDRSVACDTPPSTTTTESPRHHPEQARDVRGLKPAFVMAVPTAVAIAVPVA